MQKCWDGELECQCRVVIYVPYIVRAKVLSDTKFGYALSFLIKHKIKQFSNCITSLKKRIFVCFFYFYVRGILWEFYICLPNNEIIQHSHFQNDCKIFIFFFLLNRKRIQWIQAYSLFRSNSVPENILNFEILNRC